jgi:hypothetical protein
MRHVSKFVAAAAGLACAAGLAFAADQTILGKSLTVKGNPDPTKRKVTASAKEKNSPNTLVGNPTLSGSAGGAVLEVFANGGTSTSQTFTLAQGTSTLNGKPFWVASGNTGFKYKDSKGEQGPVKQVQIKRSPNGQFSIKVKIQAKNGGVNIVPPNPGTSGCVALTLTQNGSGDRYSVQFGPDSKIKNSGDKLFKASKPTAEGICPAGPPPSTTTTTSTPTTTTTTTTIYGSPSRAFLAMPVDLLD